MLKIKPSCCDQWLDFISHKGILGPETPKICFIKMIQLGNPFLKPSNHRPEMRSIIKMMKGEEKKPNAELAF